MNEKYNLYTDFTNKNKQIINIYLFVCYPFTFIIIRNKYLIYVNTPEI